MNIDRVATFVSELNYDALPHTVRERARLLLVDTFGCWLAGRTQPSYQLAVRGAARAFGSASPALRALACAVAASALDFDDGHYQGGGTHLGSGILPSVLALAPRDTSLYEIVTSLIAGYEVTIRAGYLLAPRTPQDVYHASGAPVCLGAAAAASRILKLDVETTHRALCIASAQMPQATVQLPMVKESIGWGAATAVTAALLAAEGFSGLPGSAHASVALGQPPTPFDSARAENDCFVELLGSDWQLLHSYVKPYACCRAIHSALDALLDILAERHWTIDNIERIEVQTLSAAASLDYLPPPSAEHAQFSFPYALACGALRGRVGAAEMTPQALRDPDVLALGRRIALHGSVELDRAHVDNGYPAIVTVHSHDRAVERRVDHASGGPHAPWSRSEIAAKFLANAEPVLGVDAACAVLAQLLDEEQNSLPDALCHALEISK